MDRDEQYRFPRESATRQHRCLWCGKWVRPSPLDMPGYFSEYCSFKCRSAAMPEISWLTICSGFVIYVFIFSSIISSATATGNALPEVLPYYSPMLVFIFGICMLPGFYQYYIGRRERQLKGIRGGNDRREGDWSRSRYD